MIFRQEMVDAILAGRKTQTRRPVKHKTLVCGCQKPEPCQYQVGKTYAVQPGRGKHGVARILVTGVRREPWGAITEQEAVAEGFEETLDAHLEILATARENFLAYVCDLYPDLDLYAECHVIEFELVSETEGVG